MKQIKVHNPGNLPVRPYQELHDFQDDFKHDIEPEALKKLKNSLVRHGVFVPKFVWLDGEKACIIDGHQTRKALESLEAEGYTIPPIPYVEVQAESRADAAEKLLQINSRYAKINPEADFFRDLENAKELLERIEIPEIRLEGIDILDLTLGDGENKQTTYDKLAEKKGGVLFAFGDIITKLPDEIYETFYKKIDLDDVKESLARELCR